MANIQPYIDQILNAVYGEEVRSSIVNALEKVNDDNNSYADLKKEVIAAKDAVDKDVDAVQQKLNAASTALTNLQNATSAANTAKTNLQNATNTANAEKSNLTSATSTANTAKSNVEAATNAAKTAISNANAAKTNLEKVITSATTTQSNLQGVIDNAKFYYLVCPVEYDPIDTGIGYHLRKANYYVSEKPRAGFRLHPAFYDASGNEIDYFLTSAYEGSIYDASASAYLLNDEQVMNTGEDKFSSIAGARPASGSSQNLTRPNIEAMAQNRGTNWHGDLIKQVSAEQMLMIIEMGMMNLQTAIAQGVVSLPWTTGSDTTSSYAAATGSTASLGNGTGRAEKTTTYEGGVAKEYTIDGKTSVCWRGKENFWGNIWKFVYGINIWGNGKMGGGQPYICSDFSFAESKNSGNYEPAGFTVTNTNGYISAMGYSTACDWLFIASECLGNSSLPVGDYTYITVNLNGYRIARLGGDWDSGGVAGGFCWALHIGVGTRGRDIGGRLVYIPTRDSATYTAAIEAWKQKMAA